MTYYERWRDHYLRHDVDPGPPYPTEARGVLIGLALGLVIIVAILLLVFVA